jgi:hypothetical protein
MEAIKNGRDVRALTAMLDRIYSNSTDYVQETLTFDEIRKLSVEERRQLWRQLQAAGRAPSLTVDDMRAALDATCQKCGAPTA